MNKLSSPRKAVSAIVRQSISFIQGFPNSMSRIWKKKTPPPIQVNELTDFFHAHHLCSYVVDFIPKQFFDNPVSGMKHTIIISPGLKSFRKQMSEFFKKKKVEFVFLQEKTGWIDEDDRGSFFVYSVENLTLCFFVVQNNSIAKYVYSRIRMIEVHQKRPGIGHQIGIGA